MAALAQPSTSPTTQSDVRELKGVITGVEGLVQVRLSDDQSWRPAQVGMAVEAGAEFRTGPRSAVRIEIPPDQTITLDRLGTLTLLQAVRQDKRVQTDLGMRYGRVRYDIEAAGLRHDARIYSPGHTLAVRGTQVSLFNQGFYPVEAQSLTGRAVLHAPDRRELAFGDVGQRAFVLGSRDAADTALERTLVEPILAMSRREDERDVALASPLVAGLSFGTNVTRVSRGVVQRPTALIGPSARGSLLFELSWTGSAPGAPAPDIDLFVRSPLGEVLCPKGCGTLVLSGGRAPQDDRGGERALPSQEVGGWFEGFPAGTYRYGVRHVSGGVARFEVLVRRDGRIIAPPLSGLLGSAGTTSTGLVNVGQVDAPEGSTVVSTARAAAAGRRQIRKER